MTSRYDELWKENAARIAARRLQGLAVSCPICGSRGTLLSKWVPGSVVKPLYVVHGNANGTLDACYLECETDANAARSAIGFTAADARRALAFGRAFVMFSGGRDSLCLVEYLRTICRHSKKKLTVLHANTTAGFPEVQDYVEEVCRQMGLDLVVVRPKQDFFDLAKRWGIPGVKSRWCCSTLKIAPMRRYLSGIREPKVIFDGIRAAESHVRAKYVPVWFHPAFRSICVSPLFTWPDDKVDRYIERHALPVSPTAELGTSGECWCGAYKCRADFETLLDVHPEMFDKLVEVEEAQNGKYTFLYEKGQRLPLASLKSDA